MHISEDAHKLAVSEHSPGSPCVALTSGFKNCTPAWRNTHLAILHARQTVHVLNVPYLICSKAGDDRWILEEKLEVNRESDFYLFYTLVVPPLRDFFYATCCPKAELSWVPKQCKLHISLYSLSIINVFRIFRDADKDQVFFLLLTYFVSKKLRTVDVFPSIR